LFYCDSAKQKNRIMKIRIGGVPEHFNYPWQYGIKNNYFKNAGIQIEWYDFPGGTGAMAEALKNNELDMAILLTEGAIKEIVQGANYKISKTYVDSPLIWGIHTSSKNKNANLSNLGSMKYAISRIGSGSHLMAYVHAAESNVQLRDNQMNIVGNINNARKSLEEKANDLFFWEKFMTKPFVDSGELVRLGCYPTPWPCFMIVTNNTFNRKNYTILNLLFDILNNILLELKTYEPIANEIATTFHLKLNDTRDWLKSTEWNCNFDLKGTSLTNVCKTLKELSLINSIPPINELIHESVNLTK
jgi:sulfonate transport system substrate-binding protein